MYHIFFVLLFLFSTVDFFSSSVKKITALLSLGLLCFVTLRYGQGSDYFSYIYLFNNSAEKFELFLENGNLRYITQEIGFSAISYIWIILFKLSPELLSALFSAVSYILTWLFIKKYSSNPIISLFFFYCTFYLIYPFSAIRQGICISIFIYYLIPLLYRKKYTRYFLLSLFLVSIHFSSIILFILPIVNLVKKYKPRQIYILSLISFLIGLVLYQALFSFFSTLDMISGKIEAYTETTSLDIMSLLLRTVIFIPIILTYKLYKRNSIRDLFLKIYILGFLLYLVFMASTLISSRINVFMRYFEIILLVDFLLFVFKRVSNRVISYGYIFAIMTIVYVKNIDSFIDQGPYYNHINFYNYPYVSVFNKKKIVNEREIVPFYQQYINYD
ncbi:EpsG family protein [Proteiniphilum saccharofermentans]|uniref:EpsG family protein n=1 Tax=Proteiniphilum saccharofermentans TaxID=1642647 RepID=UPI003918B32D